MPGDLRIVFAHGSGRVGRAAFPQQSATFPDEEFPVLPGYGDEAPTVGDVASAAQRLALRGAGADALVGYSYGGVAAAMAACLERVGALVLIEPALFQLSRDPTSASAASSYSSFQPPVSTCSERIRAFVGAR